MTGKEIVSQWRSYGMLSNAVSFGSMVAMIDAAIAAEREAVAQLFSSEEGIALLHENHRLRVAIQRMIRSRGTP